MPISMLPTVQDYRFSTGCSRRIFGCNGYSNTYFDLIIAAATLQLSESDRASGS